jgi:hypothetical protein
MKLHSSAMTAGAATLAAVLGLGACVTINIYFPAAAAEKAADRIIDEVWQLQQKDAPKKAEPATEKEPTK